MSVTRELCRTPLTQIQTLLDWKNLDWTNRCFTPCKSEPSKETWAQCLTDDNEGGQHQKKLFMWDRNEQQLSPCQSSLQLQVLERTKSHSVSQMDKIKNHWLLWCLSCEHWLMPLQTSLSSQFKLSDVHEQVSECVCQMEQSVNKQRECAGVCTLPEREVATSRERASR